MSNANANAPFIRNAFITKPGIVGARWWQESVKAPVGRRAVLVAALIGGVGIIGVGTVFALASSSSTPDTQTVTKGALDMQREYGWSFGAADETLKLEGTPLSPMDQALLSTLPDKLKPTQSRHQPFYQATLFQAPSALPKAVPSEDNYPVTPLAQAIRPVMTPSMRDAYQQGRAFASVAGTVGKDTAVIVDLPGPEAVAFAAGASTAYDPVFLFDNWPHPRGVVASHLTLASTISFAPAFAAAAKIRGATPMPGIFVLDRNRLATYTDEATQFDNRYVAKVPDAARLKAMGYRNVMYVVPKEGDADLDDLNEDFVAWQQASIPVRIVATSAFQRSSDAKSRPVSGDFAMFDDGSTYYYGGSDTTHRTFSSSTVRPVTVTPRRTAYSSGTSATSSAGARPKPPSFGLTPVIVAAGTGLILGSRLSRSGSWNRSGGSSFG